MVKGYLNSSSIIDDVLFSNNRKSQKEQWMCWTVVDNKRKVGSNKKYLQNLKNDSKRHWGFLKKRGTG